MPDKKTGPQPMDPRIKENPSPVARANSPRVCHGIKTLVAEFNELFPETTVEYSNYEKYNTATDVTFDMTAIPEDGREQATQLLKLTELDTRVDYVLTSDEGVLVSFKPSLRTQDSRDPFGLGTAWLLLADGESR